MAFLIPFRHWLVRKRIHSRRGREMRAVAAFLGAVVGTPGGFFLPVPGLASHESFGTYETWSSPTIRSDRWRGGENFGGQEAKREIEAGTLRMRFRREGETVSDVGENFSNLFLNITAPTTVDQMEATFTITNITVSGCAANPTPSRTQAARMVLFRMNDGSSGGPGDRTGDHFGDILASRASSDMPDAVRVFGAIERCSNPTCLGATVVSSVELPMVTVGTPFRLRLIWDAPNSRFLFGLNDNPDVLLSYDPAIFVGEAAVPVANIQSGHRTANCTAGATITDSAIEVGEVKTNLSGIIP